MKAARNCGIIILLMATAGCASPRAASVGVIYTDNQSGLSATSSPAGTRVGEACLQSILGLVSWGDASIEAARRNGGVSTITSVDEKSTSILGFVYGKFCTVVRGR